MSIGEQTIAFILSLHHVSSMVDDPISPCFHAKLVLEETHFAILYSTRGFCPCLHQVAFLLLNMNLAATRWMEWQSKFVFLMENTLVHLWNHVCFDIFNVFHQLKPGLNAMQPNEGYFHDFSGQKCTWPDLSKIHGVWHCIIYVWHLRPLN